MTAYLTMACGAVFLSVVVSFIIPQGRLGKSITVVMRLICIAILISPLLQLFGISVEDTEVSIDYDYICAAYSENQSRALEELIESTYGVQSECTVEIAYGDDGFSVQGVEVCLISSDSQIAGQIYEYLEEAGYINITVYEQDSLVD